MMTENLFQDLCQEDDPKTLIQEDLCQDLCQEVDPKTLIQEDLCQEDEENFRMMIENTFQDSCQEDETLCQEDHPVPLMSTKTAEDLILSPEDLILSPGWGFFNQLEDDPIFSQPKKKTRYLL